MSGKAAAKKAFKGKSLLGKAAFKRRLIRLNPTFGKATLRRLATRAGILRFGQTLYEPMREEIHEFLKEMLFLSITFTDHAKRSTISALDVIHAAKHKGITFYRDDEFN